MGNPAALRVRRLAAQTDRSWRRSHFVVLLVLCLCPCLAHADGIVPLLNVFHRETWISASVVTLVIILIESGLLRWYLKESWYPGCLWRSAGLNLASSAVASVLLLLLHRNPFYLWDTPSLLGPLFLITVCTEIPLLHRLCRHRPMTWALAGRLGTAINLLSYVAVFAVEIGLMVGALAWSSHLDRRDEASWNKPALLRLATGAIYATTRDAERHLLQVCDPATGTWRRLDGCPALDPYLWDVEGTRCAFVPAAGFSSSDHQVVVAALPGFGVVREMDTGAFRTATGDGATQQRGIADLALSPDGSRLALLLRLTEAVAYRDRSSYWRLGERCRLIVLDLASGKEVARAPRPASDRGLCWLPDSATVLFPSFDDVTLYDTPRSAVRGDTSHGIGHAERDMFPRSLFALEVTSGAIRRFAVGEEPALAAQAGKVLVRQGTALCLLDIEGREETRYAIPRLGHSGHAIAPDAALIVVALRPHMPLRPGSFLTLMDPRSASTRHIIDRCATYRYDWSRAPGAVPSAPVTSAP